MKRQQKGVTWVEGAALAGGFCCTGLRMNLGSSLLEGGLGPEMLLSLLPLQQTQDCTAGPAAARLRRPLPGRSQCALGGVTRSARCSLKSSLRRAAAASDSSPDSISQVSSSSTASSRSRRSAAAACSATSSSAGRS